MSSRSVGYRRRRRCRRCADGQETGRLGTGGAAHRYWWGRPRGHDGRRHQSEHAPREYARPSRARQALFAGISIRVDGGDFPLSTDFFPQDLCVWTLRRVRGCAADLQNFNPPLAYLTRARIELFIRIFIPFFKDTPYSRNSTSVWLRGFLTFSPLHTPCIYYIFMYNNACMRSARLLI